MERMGKVTRSTFEQEVLGADQPVLAVFTTGTCPACHAARPMLEGLAREFEGRARIVEVNVEEEPELGAAFQIRAVPTLAFFKDGNLVDGVVGSPPTAVLRRTLDWLSGACAPQG